MTRKSGKKKKDESNLVPMSDKWDSPDSAQRVLQIDVLEARGLLACYKGTSDSYVVVSLTDGTGLELKAETFSTKITEKTLNPQWNHSFFLGM